MIYKFSRRYRNTYISLLSLKKTLKSSKSTVKFFNEYDVCKGTEREKLGLGETFILPSLDYLNIKNKIDILFTAMIMLTVM